MKKTILMLEMLGLLSTGSAKAQWSVTPEVGLTAVTSENANDNSSWLPSWRLGVGVDYQIPRTVFSISSGVYLTERPVENVDTRLTGYYGNYWSGNDNGHTIVMIPGGTEADPKQWAYTLQTKRVVTSFYVPITMKASLPVSENVNFTISAGPYVGYAFCNKVRKWSATLIPAFDAGENEHLNAPSVAPYTNSISYFDWGLVGRLGLEIQNWVIEGGYEASLGKYDSPYHSWTMRKLKDHFHTVTLSVGYKFQL